MQGEDPMLSMLRLAVAEARAVMGYGSRTPSFERDVARLCVVVAIVSGRRAILLLRARLLDRHGPQRSASNRLRHWTAAFGPASRRL